SPLFDTSGGAGLTPDDLEESWPMAWPGKYCGYAGGLGPDNVADELEKIFGTNAEQASTFWIDMETKVRSYRVENFRKVDYFDLSKCEQVCKQVAPFILEA